MFTVPETLATSPRRWLRFGVLVAMTGVIFRLLGLFFRRCEVEGASMAPHFLPGDRLLFRRVLRPASLREGSVVCLEDPRPDEARLIVKRIVAIEEGRADLRGDNPAASTDSRDFGMVPCSSIAWVLLRRYGRASD